MSSCPNKHHPDWKALEARFGEIEAFNKFIENGYEIPVITNKVSGVAYDVDGTRFKSRDTLQALNENPELAKQIINKLKALYPEIRIDEGGIFDENGQFKQLEAGEQGMHYRNAFTSAVAWANDSYLETPPHEYAHAYIEMFRDDALVQEGIKKYGEERLVSLMGRHFAKQEMSNSFVKYVEKFWSNIKSLFGSPDIAYALSDNFYKGNKLEGAIHQGTGIYRYQKVNTPYTRIKGAFAIADKFKSALVPAKSIERKAVLVKMRNQLAKRGYDEDSKSMNEKRVFAFLSEKITKIKAKDVVTDANGQNPKYRNSALLDERLLDDAYQVLDSKGESLSKVAEKILDPASEVELSIKEQATFDILVRIDQRLAYMNKYRNSFADGNGSLIDMKPVMKAIKSEIAETADRRTKLYDKVKNKHFKKLLKGVEKVLRYQLNGRLVAKYLSGGENTQLSNMFYKSLDHAESVRLKISSTFATKLTEEALTKSTKTWSFFNQQDSEIDQLETQDVKVFVDDKSATIKMTKAEIMTAYLNLRQEDSSRTLRDYGFYLDDQIPGRDLAEDAVIKFDIASANNIIATVEANPDMMKVVEKIDGALDYMYDETNEVFSQENGYALPKYNNYFPVYTGEKSVMERLRKSNINDYRAGHGRLGQDSPLRIGDVMAVMTNIKNSGSAYSAFALPIENNRKMLKGAKEGYHSKSQEAPYFDMMEGLLKRLEDNSNLYSNQGEGAINKGINMLTSNFAVSVLGMNIPVMLKQPISYLTAMEEIDSKYLKQAGWGIGGIVGINPKAIMNSLKITGVAGGETKLPIEWRVDSENPIFKEMVKNSPKMKARLEGLVSKEAGEALMNADIGKDKIKMPWKNKDGTPVYISKSRLMEGIKVFDSATVMAIWKAAKLETAETHPDLKEGSEAYWEHIEGRVNEIVNKTQPTYDLTNRAEMSSMSNPIVRVLTMFSSARSKVAMQMIDGIISYMANPTAENKAKLVKRSANILITTSLALTAVNLLKTMAYYGMDDDEFPEFVITDTLNNNLGYIYGIGTLAQLTISQMDSKPWHKSMQHPVEMMAQDISHALAHLFKGNMTDAAIKSIEAVFKTTGLPLQSEIIPKALYKRFNEDI